MVDLLTLLQSESSLNIKLASESKIGETLGEDVQGKHKLETRWIPFLMMGALEDVLVALNARFRMSSVQTEEAKCITFLLLFFNFNYLTLKI